MSLGLTTSVVRAGNAISFEFLTAKLGDYHTAKHWPAARSVAFFDPGMPVRPVCKCGWESKVVLHGKDSIDRAIRWAFERHIDALTEASS